MPPYLVCLFHFHYFYLICIIFCYLFFFLILSFALFSRFRVGSGGFRLVPGASGGSGRFRAGSVIYIHPFVCGSRATYFVFTTFLCHLWSITEYEARQHGIYLLNRPWEIVVYGWLLITRTLANSNLALTRTKVDFPGFPSYIYYNFTPGNSNPL